MHHYRFLFLLAFCGLSFQFSAQTALKSPDAFLPHQLGEQFTPHHWLTQYFEYLAANAPTTMRLERYGTTNEARPLQVAYFSSPENIARLEQIRQENVRLARPAGNGRANTAPATAIVWLSMSVHGNEPSGSECSMLLAYQLASQTEAEVREWLKNTVVILDPSLNPDGYDRYTHWYRSVSNLRKNPRNEGREHVEPWPRGRTNHYHYDLNRDWAWATQVETQQRLALYHRWLPHVHADLHEQYIDNPYYFAPAAEPMHDYITPWQRDFQTRIGENHAGYFDQNGWLYFTKEVFDLFYPSYGDTYPMFNGAIGMTYEQAGHSTAGRAVLLSTGDTLTLHERIQHHLTTSRSTIEMASRNAASVVENFRKYFERSAAQPQGPYLSFVIPAANNDPNKVNALCRLLDRHHIQYGRAGASASGLKGFNYVQGKETTFDLGDKDVVISAYQPHSVLLQVLFEPEHRLSDSLTYDITAWALPHAYGLEAYALKQRLEPKRSFEPYKAPEMRLSASPYAWCVHRKSLAEARFLAQLLEDGVKVRYAMQPFALSDQQFEAGALVIARADNMPISADLDAWVQAAAAEANVALHPIFSGWANKGRDLGSDNFVPIHRPEVAVVYGDEVDDNPYGHTWFFFEQELNYPVTPIALDRLHRIRLSDYTTLIFPNGNYNLSDNTLRVIQEWVRQGGRLIAFENGVRAFADKDGFELKSKSEPKKDTATTTPKPYQTREREGVSDAMPGAVVQTQVDATHPLAFGFSGRYFSLKTTSNLFEMPTNAHTPIWVGENFQSYGFIGSRLKGKLKNTPVVAVQRMGMGDVVYFVDNPLFRSFWEQGKVLFANAVFH